MLVREESDHVKITTDFFPVLFFSYISQSCRNIFNVFVFFYDEYIGYVNSLVKIKDIVFGLTYMETGTVWFTSLGQDMH